MWRIQSRYWTQTGLSMPSSFSMAARSEALTYPPAEKRMSTMSPGARRRSAKITSDIPNSVSAAMPRRWRR